MSSDASFDLLLRNARLSDAAEPSDIGVRGGRIAAIGPALSTPATLVCEAGGRAVLPGFVDTHVHLDKACLLGRCGHDHGSAGGGDLSAAIRAVSELKRSFTEEDVYARGARVLDKAIVKGTTRMRTHVEIDPRVGLRSFSAIKKLKQDYAWAIHLQICAFPQEGLTNDPGTEELLMAALKDGADLLGGCPYTDTDPNAQIARLFALARDFNVDLDFHLDFDLDPSWRHLDEVCRQTVAHGWQGRVAIGHVTKLSALPPEQLVTAAALLSDSGVALTVLPATDLYLTGRNVSHNVPRGLTPAHILNQHGVTCSIATNNVLNPFTPFGDASLLRMANFYANVAQVDPGGFAACLDLVTHQPARLMKLTDYGIAVGNPADFVILDSPRPSDALAELAEPCMVFKNGRQTVRREPAQILRG
jgi:cytosine deaminase